MRVVTEPTPAADLNLYLRCPRRYYYRRVLNLPDGEHTPYAAFKRAVTAALTAADPTATLDAAFEDARLDPDHPHADLYRQAANDIVTRGAHLPTSVAAPTLAIPLENGTVTIQPDAVTNDGATYETRTFRKPPSEDKAGDEIPADRHMSLLQAAAELGGQINAPTLHIRYLQSGAIRPIANKPKIRAKHLLEYEGALRGIQLQMFEPTPADAGDCPLCPYFFICPT